MTNTANFLMFVILGAMQLQPSSVVLLHSALFRPIRPPYSARFVSCQGIGSTAKALCRLLYVPAVDELLD